MLGLRPRRCRPRLVAHMSQRRCHVIPSSSCSAATPRATPHATCNIAMLALRCAYDRSRCDFVPQVEDRACSSWGRYHSHSRTLDGCAPVLKEATRPSCAICRCAAYLPARPVATVATGRLPQRWHAPCTVHDACKNAARRTVQHTARCVGRQQVCTRAFHSCPQPIRRAARCWSVLSCTGWAVGQGHSGERRAQGRRYSRACWVCSSIRVPVCLCACSVRVRAGFVLRARMCIVCACVTACTLVIVLLTALDRLHVPRTAGANRTFTAEIPLLQSCLVGS